MAGQESLDELACELWPAAAEGAGSVNASGEGELARIEALVAAETSRPGDLSGTAGGLRRLCSAAVRAVPARAAGVSLMGDAGVRGLAAASDPACAQVDEIQFVLGDGPCLEAFATRRPVLEPDLSVGGAARWPVYSAAAQDEGVAAVFAFPLQVGAARLGVLDLYRRQRGPLLPVEFTRALTFADVATAMILDGQEKAPPGGVAAGLDEAMEYRFELYQAQGMVMVQLGVTLVEALVRLRAYGYARNRGLSEVARDVVTRGLRLDDDRAVVS